MQQHPPFVIYGPVFCLESSCTQAEDYGIYCVDGKIQAVLPIDKIKEIAPKGVKTIEFSAETVLLPGMIDLHIHGAAGSDVMDATPQALKNISEALFQEGTTGFLATTMTESSPNIVKALKNISKSSSDGLLKDHLLGVHLEGPFLAKSKMGAQCEKHILDPDPALFDEFYAAADGKIKIVTLAPERPGAFDFIRHIVKRGVVASIGHTDATYQETKEAVKAGASYATHLFNAMRGIHHREPGCACAILRTDEITAELIVDGVHVHPEMISFALKLKGSNRIVLVTDAMRAKCLGEGVFDLGGQQVTVKGKEARLQDGTLAGSVLTMKEAFLNIQSFVPGVDWVHASQLVSGNPAKVAGCFGERGSLTKGKRADFIVMSKHGTLEATFFSGCRVK